MLLLLTTSLPVSLLQCERLKSQLHEHIQSKETLRALLDKERRSHESRERKLKQSADSQRKQQEQVETQLRDELQRRQEEFSSAILEMDEAVKTMRESHESDKGKWQRQANIEMQMRDKENSELLNEASAKTGRAGKSRASSMLNFIIFNATGQEQRAAMELEMRAGHVDG